MARIAFDAAEVRRIKKTSHCSIHIIIHMHEDKSLPIIGIPSNYLAHKNIGRRRGHNNYNIIYK